MNLYTVPFYKNAPFVRLVLPFASGLLIQWFCNFHLSLLTGSIFAIAFLLFLFHFQPLRYQYASRAFAGISIHLMVMFCGCICMFCTDDKNDPSSVFQQYQPGSKLILTINEPLTEKPGSYKSSGTINGMINGKRVYHTTGIVLIYFEKNPAHLKLKYGDIIIIAAKLQQVSNTGNPAAFDYRQYCYLQGIHYQVFLTEATYKISRQKSINKFRNFIFNARQQVVSVMQKYIPGSKESGLAQALLIGYKDNLDKELVQAYSNTGVVHVIAISGLHLGLIYAILILLTRKLRYSTTARVIQLLIVIAGIWIFAIMAGASASVVRSAVMFTCIATGKVLARNLSVYNSLAASAFLLLCYNPFWLWDTGFQLSYAAVLSIIIYQKSVSQLLPFSNKILLIIWKTCAITLSAQILTTPVSLYYFHQFPNFFLITNFVAIPLSSIILIAEIMLCCIAFFSPLAFLIGELIHHLIAMMNWFVELIDILPFANWKSIQIDTVQQVLLYVIIAGFSYYFFQKAKTGIWVALSGMISFFMMRSLSFYNAVNQQKLIVYNVSKSSALELIEGRNALFIADTSVSSNQLVLRFNISPSRIVHRISNVYSPEGGTGKSYLLRHGGKLIVFSKFPVYCSIKPDLLIVSGNPRGKFVNFARGELPVMVVFDSSNPAWKARAWSQECKSLGIRYSAVSDEGAFVMNLN
ncbi:ComEC/Rec2 family competence protein [Flavitalea sp.]|nr:ComEC/Rec2 family competence protein [Flavitalea sp.]